MPIHFPVPRNPSPGWLSMVLRDVGKLPVGSVTDINMRPTEAENSLTIFLRPTYSDEVTNGDKTVAPPTRMVLKRSKTNEHSMRICANEVNFYRKLSEMADHPGVIPPYYAAEIDSESHASFLLIRDLSETHTPPLNRAQQISLTDSVPTLAHQHGAIDTLAAFHAYWWNRPQLYEGNFTIGCWAHDKTSFKEFLGNRIAAWQRLAAKDGARLPLKYHAFYDQLFYRLPRIFTNTLAPRFEARRDLTLTHGDAYFSNFLCPIIPNAASTYLIDWQTPACELAATDLVNLLATCWTKPQRLEGGRETTLLERYYQGLLTHGVQNYTWENLLADYRTALMFWVLTPVQQGADGVDWNTWWPQMKCLVSAFEDWD